MEKIALKDYKYKKRKLAIIVVFASAIIGLLSSLLTRSLKMLTEIYGHHFRSATLHNQWLIFILPLSGLTMVWLLRKFLFKNKKNKGITEIFNNLEKKVPLPAYKVPSHYVNGLFTVAFGGSTGIEVSTVVSTAALGSVASSKSGLKRKKYKNILTCAGIAAGVTALFNAPIAGILFALEVFRRRAGWTYYLSLIVASTVSYTVNYLAGAKPVFDFDISFYNGYALPYFLLLGVLAALMSVYMTKSVIFLKSTMAKWPREYMRVVGGSMIISISIFFLPALYGEGYFAVEDLLKESDYLSASMIWIFLATLFAKPVITAITLGAGGDGGVFAPSLFVGGFLGYLLAILLNIYFNAQVIPANFMVIGMAAMLSGSIHAPFTALFLVCAMVGNYQLFLPSLVTCLVAKYSAKLILPYSVYTFQQFQSARNSKVQIASAKLPRDED